MESKLLIFDHLSIMHVYLSAYNRLSTPIFLSFREQMYVMAFLSVSFSANEERRSNITFIIIMLYFYSCLLSYMYLFVHAVFLKGCK